MIRVEDLSEVGYGGVVTGMGAWDVKRVIAGTLDPKNVVKSAKFWGYLAPGVVATIMQAMGKRQWAPVTERVMHGFFFGLPGFVLQMAETLKGGTSRAANSAVSQAQQILQQRNAELAANRAGLLTGGARAGVVTPGVLIEEQEILS